MCGLFATLNPDREKQHVIMTFTLLEGKKKKKKDINNLNLLLPNNFLSIIL